MKNLFDYSVSFIATIILLPIFISIAIIIKITSKGPIFFLQTRVGKNKQDFKIIKFRTMIVDAEKKGLPLTVGNRDLRVTSIGLFLRKYKLDELPQLINILKGEMSFVGPRPEVPKYVEYYNEDQLKVLSVKPGITDIASIEFVNENELLEGKENPEDFYIKEILPKKLQLNLDYLATRSFLKDIQVIFKTLFSI